MCNKENPFPKLGEKSPYFSPLKLFHVAIEFDIFEKTGREARKTLSPTPIFHPHPLLNNHISQDVFVSIR